MRTRSKTKRTRENLNRLPREVEATLPSWVKCTDPISAETLKEVRSTVLVWLANVRNYRNKLYEDFGYSHTDELEQELMGRGEGGSERIREAWGEGGWS